MYITNEDLTRISKIVVLSFISLVIIGCFIYFLFPYKVFISITAGSLISFITFVVSLFIYYRLNKNKKLRTVKYILLISGGKLIFLGIVLFLFFKFELVEPFSFLASFLIFFTIFLNIEVLLIYKGIIFK